MDAILYLREEHSKFRKNLAEISKSKDPVKRKTKFNAFCKDLLRHEIMEQKVWYPALRKNADLRETIQHLVSEEKAASQAMKKFKKVRFEFMWKLRFYKFKRDVDHHAKEEEQGLFPKVRKVLNKTELNALGTKMRKFKAKLK